MQINALNTPFLASPYTTNQKESPAHPANQPTEEPNPNPHTQDVQSPKGAHISQTQATTSIQERTDKDAPLTDNPHPERITYGLKILELMSDEEYRAFVFASQGLSESQKMLMAQGLYRFTDLYQGRKEIESVHFDATMQQQLKAFGAQNSQIERFLTRYKNAYAQILNEGF